MNTKDFLIKQGYSDITTSENNRDQFLTENENKPIQCSIGVKTKGRIQFLGIAINTREQEYLNPDSFEDFILNQQDLKEIKELFRPKANSPLIIYTNFGIEIHSENVKDWKQNFAITFKKTLFN